MRSDTKDHFEITDDLSRVLVASSVDGILVFDDHGLIRIFSPACERLFGYAGREVIGKNVMLLMPVAERSKSADRISDVSELEQEPIVGGSRETVGKHKDGMTFPMYVSVGSGELGNEKVFVCIVHDLTNRKLDDAIREREKRLNSILSVVPDAVVVVDDSGKVKTFSPAASRLFGFAPDEVVGNDVKMLMPSPHRGWHGIPPASDRRPSEQAAAAAESGRIVIGQRKDGSKFPMEIAVGEIPDGRKRLFTAFLRDLTRRQGNEQRIVDLQAELLHVSRLSTMGQMTAAIAHELNQPLTAIANYVKAAKRLLVSGGSNEQAIVRSVTNIDKAAAQTLRAGQIINNLRDFVDKRVAIRQPEEVWSVVQDAIALAFVGAGEKQIRVELDIDPKLLPVMIAKVQVQQVIINLVRNSIDAMQTVEKGELHLTASLGDPGFVDVTVQDTGPGMPDSVSTRLFQPFVTTKESGMGIGLSICQSIIEAHGGRIWLLKSDSTGTGFRFQLPVAQREHAAA